MASPEQVAKEVVEEMCKHLVGVHPHATGLKLVPIVREALSAYATQQIQADRATCGNCALIAEEIQTAVCQAQRRVWEEAADVSLSYRKPVRNTHDDIRAGRNVVCGELDEEFRRRAQDKR